MDGHETRLAMSAALAVGLWSSAASVAVSEPLDGWSSGNFEYLVGDPVGRKRGLSSCGQPVAIDILRFTGGQG